MAVDVRQLRQVSPFIEFEGLVDMESRLMLLGVDQLCHVLLISGLEPGRQVLAQRLVEQVADTVVVIPGHECLGAADVFEHRAVEAGGE